MKRALLPIVTFARIDIRRAFRDKVAVFFIFLFPLIFLFVFGGIFGNRSGGTFTIALINKSNSSFSKEFVSNLEKSDTSIKFKLDKEAVNEEIANTKMTRGEIDATVILPENFGEVHEKSYPTGELQVRYNQTNEQSGATLAAVFEQIFSDVNTQFVATERPFTVAASSTIEKGLTRFDYVFAGLLGFSILSLGIFGPTNVFPRLKSKGVLRRYHTTPLKVWQYFIGQVLSTAFVGILSIALMYVTAVTVFDLQMRGDYFSFAFIVLLGVIVLFGIGLAVGGWAKNENQAAPLANLVTFPMMFLSGTFFPRFAMPEWLQGVSDYLPLTPVIDGIRLVVTEGNSVLEILPQVGLLLGWGVVVYAIAFKVFRWE